MEGILLCCVVLQTRWIDAVAWVKADIITSVDATCHSESSVHRDLAREARKGSTHDTQGQGQGLNWRKSERVTVT